MTPSSQQPCCENCRPEFITEEDGSLTHIAGYNPCINDGCPCHKSAEKVRYGCDCLEKFGKHCENCRLYSPTTDTSNTPASLSSTYEGDTSDSWRERFDAEFPMDIYMLRERDYFKSQTNPPVTERASIDFKAFIEKEIERAREEGFHLGMLKDSDYDYQLGRTAAFAEVKEIAEGMIKPEESLLYGDMDEAQYYRTKAHNAALSDLLDRIAKLK